MRKSKKYKTLSSFLNVIKQVLSSANADFAGISVANSLTTHGVFVTANPNREVGNNLEVVSHFTIRVIMFCVF